MRENGRNLGGALAELVNNFGLRRRANYAEFLES